MARPSWPRHDGIEGTPNSGIDEAVPSLTRESDSESYLGNGILAFSPGLLRIAEAWLPSGRRCSAPTLKGTC
jgi:hypothetical protein